MKPKQEWIFSDGSGMFPHQQRTVFERDQVPLLYGPKGEPLVKARPPFGFDPKRAKL